MNQENKKEENNSNNIEKRNNTNVEHGLCPICLNPINNRAVLDTCLHEFCFSCISEWSQQHNRCPSCRQRYRNIMHNIRSDSEFELMPVQETIPVNNFLIRLFLTVQVSILRDNLRTQRENVLNHIALLRLREQQEIRNKDDYQLDQVREEITNSQNLLSEIDQSLNRLNSTVNEILGTHPQQAVLINSIASRHSEHLAIRNREDNSNSSNFRNRFNRSNTRLNSHRPHTSRRNNNNNNNGSRRRQNSNENNSETERHENDNDGSTPAKRQRRPRDDDDQDKRND